MKNYIMYLRKSRADSPELTVEEVLQSHETQLQEYALREFGYEIPKDNIYREVVSGETIDARPMLKAIMRRMEESTIDGVIVIEPQRLSRGDLEDCGRIINTFRYTDTLVLTPVRTYDISSEYDRKFFEMELTRGNDYLEYTKKILSRGRLAAVKRGNYLGSEKPYGYRKVQIKNGKRTDYTLEIIEKEADVIRLMYHLFVVKNWGFKRIANHLDELGITPQRSLHWSPASIKDILENPLYTGKIRWNWRKTKKVMQNGNIVQMRPKTKDPSQMIVVDGLHEAIIDEDTFNACLEKRGKNPAVRKNKSLENPFAGILKCQCGTAMSMKKYINRRSKASVKPTVISMICNDQAYCHTHSVKYYDLLDMVIDMIEKDIADMEAELTETGMTERSLREHISSTLHNELQALYKKDERQKDAFDDGIYSKAEFETRNAQTRLQIENVLKRIKENEDVSPVEYYPDKIVKLKELIRELRDESIPAENKNRLLKSMISKIVYHNDLESSPGIGRYLQNVFTLDITFK